MDKIALSNLEINCIVGIYPHERTSLQTLYLDIDIECDLKLSTASDNITDTLDYDKVANLATNIAVEKKFQLIESLAQEINLQVLSNFPKVTKCKVTVKKPAAVPKAEFAAVTLEQYRV